MDITTVVVSLISSIIVIGVAVGHVIERSIYWSKQKDRQDVDRATGDLDKMLSDFRALAELVVSETDKTKWLWVKDAQGRPIKQRQRKTNDLRTGQMAFDESREWDFKIMENQLNHYFVSLHD